MSMKTAETFAEIGIPVNPFPGLRPFEFEESHLFFGRDGQSEQLISKLGHKRFVAVVGTSGSGKSSLVRAGLLPALHGGFMTSAGSGWRVAIMRPGNDPIGNLAQALNAPDVFGSEIAENAALQTALAEATLRRGSLGLVGAVRQAAMPHNENLLIVVDQFEEIFRFARVAASAEYRNEAAAFVKLILEASQQSEVRIYVALTMRSDYLGDCSQFWDLPEAVNESQYLIPRLTRDQLREAITGPVAVGGGAITSRLVNRLLNDVGDNQDQLPVLQHLLMRAWDEWKEKRLAIEVEAGDQTITRPHKEVHEGEAIDLCCYEAVGGMTEALSRHADEAFNDLPDDRHRGVAEKLFKALTEKGSDNREIRRPITLAEICAMANARAPEVMTVIETFRQSGRSFLMPAANYVLTSESLVDISHESLIRGWERLRTWVDEEARSARIYRRLAETAALHREGKAGLWGDPDLQLALDWYETNKPNEHWAQRYDHGFETAIAFLQASEQKRADEIADRERQQQAEIKRAKRELEQAQALAVAEQQRAEAEQQKAEERQQRLDQQTRATSRLRRLLVALVVLALLALGTAVFAFAAQAKANGLAKIANDRAVEINRTLLLLETAKKDVEGKREEAERLALKEKEQREIAETQKRKADEAKLVADDQRRKAEQSAHVIEKQNKEAVVLNDSLKKQIELATFAVARHLRNVADSEWNPTGEGLVHSSLLALESLKSAWTPEGYETLARALNLLPSPATKIWEVHTGPVLSMEFSHNRRWLATRSRDVVKVWDVGSQKELHHVEIPSNVQFHSTTSFSPDDRWLVIGLGRFAGVWDTNTWKQIKELPNGQFVWSVTFSSDGRFIATVGYSSNVARVYETSTDWPEIAQIKTDSSSLFSAVFIPNSHWLAVSDSNGTQVWDVTKPQQEPLGEISHSTDYQNPPVFSSDGHWLATGGSGLWEVTKNATSVQFKAFTPEGPPKGLTYQGWPKAFTPDARQVVTIGDQRDDAAHVWNVLSEAEITRVVEGVSTATFSPDGHWLITGHTDGTIKEWAIDAKEAVRLPHGDNVQVQTVAYSPDGKWLATGSSDRSARVFQTTDWHEVARMQHEAEVSTVVFSVDSRWLITLNKNTMQTFETGSWRKVFTKPFEKEVETVAFSSDGRRLIAMAGKTVQLYVLEGANWREVAPMEHDAPPVLLSFSPDSKWMATKTAAKCDRYQGLIVRTETRVWDLATGEKVAWLFHDDEDRCHKKPDGPQAPSGGRIALASESATWLQAIKVTKEKKYESLSRDGHWQASMYFGGGEVSLLDPDTTGKGITIPHVSNDFDFSPDGHWLATAGDDGTLRLWPLWKDGLIKEACARLPHNLSREAREKYLKNPDFPDTCPGLPLPKKE
jgi:WD40 repeat protein/energy-coupling factor transporter ATP-binding protein EcfA2